MRLAIRIEKAKKFPEGTIRKWGQAYYIKRNGKWVVISGGRANIEHKLNDMKAALSVIRLGAEEATVKNLRPDLIQYGGSPDVTFVWGNEKKGLLHILKKRGISILHEIVATVIIGKVSKFVPSKKTVHLVRESYEAILSLDEYGKKKTWLLTGWKINEPDAHSEVSTQSVATQIRPTFSRPDLVAGSPNKEYKTFYEIVNESLQKSMNLNVRIIKFNRQNAPITFDGNLGNTLRKIKNFRSCAGIKTW